MNLIREINRLEHIVSTKLVDYNQLSGIIDNKPKFDSSSSLSISPVKEPLTVVTISLRGGKI